MELAEPGECVVKISQSLQSIERETRSGSQEALHIADEINCVQWIELLTEPRQEPFQEACFMHAGQVHEWRTAWVIA